jgi:ribosomal protein L17
MNKNIIVKIKKNEKNKTVSTWNNKEYLLNPLNHISIINRLYLNETFEGSKTAQKHINKKISSYKQQDVKKNKLSIENFIKQEELLEKLVISKLKCYYCRNKVLLFYENKRENTQWTLDRLDNSIGHNKDNVVICCLKCNLERRCKNDEKFLFTKQMKIIKME